MVVEEGVLDRAGEMVRLNRLLLRKAAQDEALLDEVRRAARESLRQLPRRLREYAR
jgi:uncharacterized protein (UPF0147 family)